MSPSNIIYWKGFFLMVLLYLRQPSKLNQMKIFIVTIIAVAISLNVFAQNNYLSEKEIIYSNPFPNSKFNNPETAINISFSHEVSNEQLQDCELKMFNQSNKIVKGVQSILEHRNILIFHPNSRLSSGERYEVMVFYQGVDIFSFEFFVDDNSNLSGIEVVEDQFDYPFVPTYPSAINSQADKYREKFGLPQNFPAIEIINSNNPGSGYYFTNRMTQTPGIPFYLIIIDTLGFPVYYREFETGEAITNFALQETGTLTYFDQSDTAYIEMNSYYTAINAYKAKNGYATDGHEVRLMNDDTYWVMIYDRRVVDMSQIVPGGQVSATVTGLILQHIDIEGFVLFEWKSWDHFEITDADEGLVLLTATGIDYVHGNAIDFDFDDNILISSRNLSEITKINRTTGEVMWRWGGSQNQFEFINDSLMFSAQHHIRYLGANRYSLFDNGVVRQPAFSRGVVYELDTDNMTATLVTNYNHFDSLVYSQFMGGFHTGPNNEKIVGWSVNQQRYVFSEFDAQGNISLEMRSLEPGGLVSYRAEKNTWETSAISFNQSGYYINEASIFDTTFLEFEITNNHPEVFELNGFNSSDISFQLSEELPINIASGETVVLNLMFIPDENRTYTSAISLFTDDEHIRIAKQFRVNTAVVTSLSENYQTQTGFILSPNPASQQVLISTNDKVLIQSISVYSSLGKKLNFIEGVESNRLILSIDKYSPGIYIIQLETNHGLSSKRLIIK